jgi:hypothetical protein
MPSWRPWESAPRSGARLFPGGVGEQKDAVPDVRILHPLGCPLQLEPIRRVYFRYRYTWFDALAGILFCGPPLLALFLLGARS